ncbi:MAG: hypothetical protein C4K47_07020 [Candidatus Thorarchaeota archaeon]|nr:MAG: hypothetical protein C4K47_07020 [Candidatus Thorarchaeota archaeon]
MDELVDRLLLIETLNSTLIHFILSSQVEGSVDPDRVDSLTQGLLRARKWMEDTMSMEGIPKSTADMMGLIAKRLAQLESLLPKLSEKAKAAEAGRHPTQEILSFLDETTVRQQAMPTNPQAAIPLVETQPTLPLYETAVAKAKEVYKRVDIEDDQWGLVSQAQQIIDQYSKRCHVLLPVFWLEANRELHRYRSDSPLMEEAIKLPAEYMVKIIKTLLTEAPGARLLQDLYSKRAHETTLEASETERLERAVAKYFSGLDELLRGQMPNVEDKISEAQTAFDGFGWGGPELEKRLIKRINQRCEEALQEATHATEPARQVIYAEITKLLSKLHHAILAEPRLREVLSQMKL